MFPVLLEFAGVKIYSYGFFIAIGYLAALLFGYRLAKARGLDPSPFLDISFIAIVSGVLGARLLFVAQNLNHYLQHPGEIWDIWNGGLVFYGGFMSATIVCVLYARWRKMSLWLSADIGFACAALAHGFGRIGCLAAGCCYGNLCSYPWGIHNHSEFVDPSLRGLSLHPVQIYEALSLFFLAGVLLWLVRQRKSADGTVTLLYLMGYATIRFVMEFFRGDADRGFVAGGWLSLSQAIALGFFVLGSGVLVCRLRSKNL